MKKDSLIKRLMYNRFSFSLISLLLIIIIISYLDYLYLGLENIKDVVIELHGLLFDIIVFGVLFLIYDVARERYDNIKKHKDEIDDMREWATQEAAIKIASRLRKLLALNVNKDISLSKCHLSKQDFSSIKISNFDFKESTLERVSFSYSSIQNSDFTKCELSFSRFTYADLSECIFNGEAILSEATFQGAKLNKVQAKNSYFTGCDFSFVELDSEYGKEEIAKILNNSYVTDKDIKNNIVATILSESEMTNSKFIQSNFKGAKILKVDFSNSSFYEANFSNSAIIGTSFFGSDCRNAIFDNCRLQELHINDQTNFEGASFLGASIKEGVNFKRAKLKGAKFSINFKPELERQGVDITELIFV